MLIRSKSNLTVQRPSTAVPNNSLKNNENEDLGSVTYRQKLNNLIPDLPSFSNKNNKSTSLLYSKFIMKGLNTNKVDLVKQSFNMKKQKIQYDKKNSLSSMKTNKSTVKSTKNQNLHSAQKINQQKNRISEFYYVNDDSKLLNSQINNFIRIKTAKRQTNFTENNHILLNVQSEKVLARPKSALSTPQTFIKRTRAQTAKHKKSISHFNPFNLEYDDSNQSQTQRKTSTFIKIDKNGGFFKNHIQKNKRLLSANSNKNSVYLTGIENNNKFIDNENDVNEKKLLIEKLTKKLSPSKNKQFIIEDLNQNDYQIERKRVPLTERQIQQINHKSKTNVHFMKENMPHQYKKYVLYLQMKQNNFTQKDRALLSINLDHNSQEFQQTKGHKKSDELFEEAKEYYTDCVNLCDEVLHQAKMYKNRNKISGVPSQILNIETCQNLLELQQQRVAQIQKSNKQMQQSQRLTEIKLKMYQLVKQLAFFRQKSQEICKKIFNLDFKISTIEEGQLIIGKDDQVNFMYIVLNGSVIKKSKNQKFKQTQIDQEPINQILQFENTFFDGQSFGQPQKKTDKNYNYEIISSEKVLLMKFSYFQYSKVYKDISNIEERIQILSKIFGNIPGCQQLKNENLQQLALQMQTLSFQANQVISRKGDPCEKLIIVSSGKVQLVNEHILKRYKKNSKDIKKRCKSQTKININDFPIENFRRKNLKNYEILHQNEEQFFYYYQDVTKQFIIGDAINWQGFFHHKLQNLSSEDNINFESPEVKKLSPFTINYSLISKVDNTKIYLIDMKKLYKLPEVIKQVINLKVNLVFQQEKKKSKLQKQNEKFTSIQKWDNFKQKICNEIVNKKIKT